MAETYTYDFNEIIWNLDLIDRDQRLAFVASLDDPQQRGELTEAQVVEIREANDLLERHYSHKPTQIASHPDTIDWGLLMVFFTLIILYVTISKPNFVVTSLGMVGGW